MDDLGTLVGDCTEHDRHAVFVACQLVALADGRVWREASTLSHIGDTLKLNKQGQTKISRQVRKQPKRKCPMPKTDTGRRLMFHFAMEVASADGRLDEREQKVVRRLGQYLEIDPTEIDTELAGVQAKAERTAPRRRDPFLEASGSGGRGDSGNAERKAAQVATPGANESTANRSEAENSHDVADFDDAETLEELLAQVRTPSEEDVYYRLPLYPAVEGTQQFGLEHAGCLASASMMWSLFCGAILAAVRASSHRFSALETILIVFVVIGFVMMIPPLLSYWFQSRSRSRSQRFGVADVRISGAALAPGCELHAEFMQSNRSGKTLHNVSMQLKLVRHVADRILKDPQGGCRSYGDMRQWPRAWSVSHSVDAAILEPGELIKGVCQFSIPEQMPLETPHNQWWGIDVVTRVSNDLDYSETMLIPPRHGVGCALSAAGAILGALLAFLTVALIGAVIVLSHPTISNSSDGIYLLCLFISTIVGFALGPKIPQRLSNRVRHHPAMSFALPAAIGIAVCVFILFVAVAPMLVSLPGSSRAQPEQSITDLQKSAKAEQQKQHEQLLKQYRRTILFRPTAELQAFVEAHPEIIDMQFEGFGYGKRTALHHFARVGKPESVKVLLELGANPNVRGYRGRTPLHIACGWKQTRVVELLLEYGADVFVQDVEGLVPRRFAELNKDDPERQAEILRMIDEHITALEAAGNSNGDTP